MRGDIEMDNEIFFPNNLTQEEVENLDGWKLQVAVLHFGKQRGDCVRFGYGYKMMSNNSLFDKKTIHLVADRDGVYKKPIDLVNEIDWDNPRDLLHECEIELPKLYKERISNKLKELK